MKKEKIIFKRTEKFKHWKNTGWSIFYSMGKHIIMSVLPVSYFLTSFIPAKAQTDTIEINEVRINSSRIPTLFTENARIIYTVDKEEISKMPVQSIQDILEYFANTDIRQRGSEGVQADISIRGGNFDQVLVLLNGFKISDTQTGHHNLNLPVNIEDIEKIEILEGPGNRIYGVNSYSGAINFITTENFRKTLKTHFFYGQNNLTGGNLNISGKYKKTKTYFSASYKRSDGYLSDSINNTDFNTFNIFFQNKIKTNFADLSFQAGYINKAFGANSFYTPRFPWQHETLKTSFFAFKTEKSGKSYKITNRLYYRKNKDKFELFREDKYNKNGNFYIFGSDTAKYVPGVFEDWNYYSGHNYHLTNFIGIETKININGKAGKSALGIDYSFSEIKSNVLGEPLETPENVTGETDAFYTKSKARNNINFYAEHLIKFKKIAVSGGISLNLDNDFKQNFSGGADFGYNFFPNFVFFASVNQSLCLPTFTDLYYDGPVNKGNPDLKPETALNYETGIKFNNKNINANISIFRRYGKNTIDWVRLSDTLDWQTMNITELTVNGAEFSFNYKPAKNIFTKKISLSYSYTDIVKQSDEYISKYALDYLKHKIVLNTTNKLTKNLFLNIGLIYENREGSFSKYDSVTKTYTGEEEYKPYTLTNIKLSYVKGKYDIYLNASNIFNVKYYEFGNIQSPGLRIKAGVKIKFDYGR